MKKQILFIVMWMLSLPVLAGNGKCVVVGDNAREDVLKIVYRGEETFLNVSIYAANGEKIFEESIRETEDFIKPYNLKGLEDGEYFLTVKGSISSFYFRLKKEEERISVINSLNMRVEKLENREYKLIVNGKPLEPVFVEFIDRNGTIIFTDQIKVDGSFERTYKTEKAPGLEAISVEYQILKLLKKA